jgi:hypothetical protein
MKRQGLAGRAHDVNDNDPMDDTFRRDFHTEKEAQTFMYLGCSVPPPSSTGHTMKCSSTGLDT